MRFKFVPGFLAVILLITCWISALASVWDESFFPNTELINDRGETVRFFDDLVKDKIVVILFIYTSCPDVCPLETAQMVKVQNLLGDRMAGDGMDGDVHFYSITIDPDVDTPEVLADYKARFGARWMHLTGDEQEIIEIRRRLGLYLEDQPGGAYNHNINLIMGNQKTGRWMTRSPFENVYVLADQIGNWLDGWTRMSDRDQNYGDAPALRQMSEGESLYRTRCATCHSLDGKDPENAIGPDLLGVTFLRDHEWLINWIRAPNEMLANRDPLAMALFEQYNRVPMPNMRLNRYETFAILDYLEDVTREKAGMPRKDRAFAEDGNGDFNIEAGSTNNMQVEMATTRDTTSEVVDDERDLHVVAVMNAWIREPHPSAPVNAAYMTIVNYGAEPLKLAEITAEAYSSVEIHEMIEEDGMRKMRKLDGVEIASHGVLILQPGGKHLMLRQPKRVMRSGDVVDMVLVFESGEEQLVAVQVDTR